MANNSSSVAVGAKIPGVCFMSVIVFDPYIQNRPDSVDQTWTFLATLNGLAAPPTIVINTAVILAILRDENLRSSAFNILLMPLAMADFIVGILVEPLYSLFLGCLLNNCLLPDCTFTAYGLSMLTSCGLSVLTLTIICVERYIAIEYPIFYRKNITRDRVMIIMGILWAICFGSLFSTSILLMVRKSSMLKVPPVVVLSIFVTIIVYCTIKVQLTAYKQSKTIALQIASVQQIDNQQELEQRKKEYKRVSTMTMIVVLSVCFYIALIVITGIETVVGKDFTRQFPYVSTPIGVTFLHLQSLINPIIMALRLSYIRHAIKKNLVQDLMN